MESYSLPQSPPFDAAPRTARRQRRAPSAQEQARREAWGRKYGAIQAEIGRRVRGET